jgi:hypothetical protein
MALMLLAIAVASAQQVVTLPLNAESNSGLTGTATLVAQGNQTKVVIDLPGEPAGASLPAHIHQGQCGPALNPKPVFPLHSVEDGTSTTVVNVPLRTLTGGRYAINVHESASNLERSVACGDIPPSVGG